MLDEELILKKFKETTDFFGEDPTNPDYLDWELRAYYEEDGPLGSPILRHPLVYQTPFFFSWKIANESFRVKTEAQIEAMKKRDFDKAIWLFEKPYRLGYLILWYRFKVITKAEMRELLPDVWINAEFPRQHKYRSILKLFRDAGYVTDAPDHHPPDEAIVFRGCAPKDKMGISWTFNPRKAAWFAQRFAKNGKVYKARITKDGVLGIFLARNEDEVVVDPKKLYDVEEMS